MENGLVTAGLPGDTAVLSSRPVKQDGAERIVGIPLDQKSEPLPHSDPPATITSTDVQTRRGKKRSSSPPSYPTPLSCPSGSDGSDTRVREESPAPKRRQSDTLTTEALEAAEKQVSNQSHEQDFKRIIAKKQESFSHNNTLSGPPLLHELDKRHVEMDDARMKQLREHIGAYSWEQIYKVIRENNVRRQQQTISLAMFFLWRFYHGYNDPEHQQQCNPPHLLEEWDRRVMVCACVFLSAKIADCPFKLRLGDLAFLLFNDQHGTKESRKRTEQIARAELYLIVSILGFDFSHANPANVLVEELCALSGRSHDEVVGVKNGIPWCVAAFRFVKHIYRTPLCVRYSARELAAGLILVGEQPFNDGRWCTWDGARVDPISESSYRAWVASLAQPRGAHVGISSERLAAVQNEMRDELTLVGQPPSIIARDALTLTEEVRNRSRSPVPSTPMGLDRRGPSLAYSATGSTGVAPSRTIPRKQQSNSPMS